VLMVPVQFSYVKFSITTEALLSRPLTVAVVFDPSPEFWVWALPWLQESSAMCLRFGLG
jgi:hypothetical protein